jgi:hypothetical protein
VRVRGEWAETRFTHAGDTWGTVRTLGRSTGDATQGRGTGVRMFALNYPDLPVKGTLRTLPQELVLD